MVQDQHNNPLHDFVRGFLTPYRAGRFICRHPRLLRYVAIPFLINTAVFMLAVWLGIGFFEHTVIRQLPQGDAWYWLLLYYFLWVLAALVTAVLVFFSFSAVGNLISSPFNDLLSERTEVIVSEDGGGGAPFSLRLFAREAWRTLREEAKKIFCFVAGMALLLLLNLIPGIGTLLYAVLSVLFTLFFLAVEYTGFVFSRKGATFRDQRHYIFSRKFLMAGFSSGVLATLAIPFLQFVCIPVAVVGATLLWCEHL